MPEVLATYVAIRHCLCCLATCLASFPIQDGVRVTKARSMAGNLSNRSSGVQIPRDICTRLKRYLYSEKCSWMIRIHFGKLRRHLSWEVQHARKLQTYITYENTQIFQKIIPEFSFPFDLFIIQFPEFLGEWLAFRKVTDF